MFGRPWRRFDDAGGDRGAIIGVLVDDGDDVDLLARLLQVVEKLDIGLGEIRRDRAVRKVHLKPRCGDVRGDRIGHQERNALPLGHRGRDQRTEEW